MDNVEHLLKLSDEYQAVKLVFNPCIKFIKDQPKTKCNVMKLLKISDLYDLDDVRRSCNNVLKDMDLIMLSQTVHLEELDREKVRHFLEQKIEGLETFLDTLSDPQFMGLVSCLLWLVHEAKVGPVSWCKEHVDNRGYLKVRDTVDDPGFSECSSCRGMLTSVVRVTNRRQ